MRDWPYRSIRDLSRVLLWPFVRLSVWRAPGAVEPAEAAVLVANHISHFDPVLLSCAFARTIDWMTSEEFYSNPVLGGLLRAVSTFPVDRSRPDQRALRLGINRLRAGRIVGVFPEGGLRAGPTSILGGAAPRSGAGALARLADVPITPCVIFGSDRLYAPRSWWPGPPRNRIWLAIGLPLSVSSVRGLEADARVVEALRNLAAAAIAHFRLEPGDLPATPQQRKGRDAQPVA